jgi:hypothetical protein
MLQNKLNHQIQPKARIQMFSILVSMAIVTFFVWNGYSLFESFSFGLLLFFVLDFVKLTSVGFPIKHLAAIIYIINYLVSPSFMYLQQKIVDDIYTNNYAMKLDLNTYYSIAFPSIMFFIAGLFSIRSNFQRYELKQVPNFSHVTGFIAGAFICLFLRIIYTDTIFFVYLLAQLRYPLAFYLFFQVSKRYWWLLFLLFSVDFYFSLQNTMFQNLTIWVIFFIMKFIQSNKYSIVKKIFLFATLLISLIYMQKTKIDTRTKWKNVNSQEIELNDESFTSNIIVRMNQGWILASAVERVDRVKDYQRFGIINLYIDNAISVRAINTEKYVARADLFNRFSGHELSDGTSMSLGIVADGYLSFQLMGALCFSFFWGWLIAFIIRQFDNFIKQDEIYYYIILIVLFYMVRPDTQVALAFNHVVKSMVLVTVYYIFKLSYRNSVIKYSH